MLPFAAFVTPNHFETEPLCGIAIENVEDLERAARIIHEASGAVVLAKGGVRLAGPDAVDAYYDGERTGVLSAPKVGEVAVSGAGCLLAAAAELAKGATRWRPRAPPRRSSRRASRTASPRPRRSTPSGTAAPARRTARTPTGARPRRARSARCHRLTRGSPRDQVER